jgi:Raf kinase inhibitor-like YbhB/YbcL family protein
VIALAFAGACSDDNDGDATNATSPTSVPDQGDDTVAPPTSSAPAGIEVTCTAFDDNDPIPEQYTCDGANDIPPITWRGVPAQATAVALVVNDPDAPRPGGFLHWAVLDLPTEGSLPPVPDGARQLPNGAGQPKWTGPCPPAGPAHHYEFTIHALGKAADSFDDIDDATLATGTLTGTYQR